jgi:hypothetical protein
MIYYCYYYFYNYENNDSIQAQGLQDPNPLIGKACESTLNLIRRKRGYWYWFRLYGDEPERLSDFFKEVSSF